MKKTDEMSRNIQLRSEEWGYRAAAFALTVWTFYNCYQTLAHGTPYNPLPALILCMSASIQGMIQLALERKMIAGEEEYHEPNKLLWGVIGSIVIAVALLSLGTYFIITAPHQ